MKKLKRVRTTNKRAKRLYQAKEGGVDDTAGAVTRAAAVSARQSHVDR